MANHANTLNQEFGADATFIITEEINDIYNDGVLTQETITQVLRYNNPDYQHLPDTSQDAVSDLIDGFPGRITKTITPPEGMIITRDNEDTPLATEYEEASVSAYQELLTTTGVDEERVYIADGATCYITENGVTYSIN